MIPLFPKEILKLSMLSFMGKLRSTLRNTSKDFPREHCSTLFATKLADTLLGHAKEGLKKNSAKDVVTTVSLSENELAGMQYLGGYVLQSLHKKT